jgi:endonuclease/exonuclease/phosphatase family metal-dependent hydrolase
LRSVIKNILLIINLLAAAVLIASYASMVIPPDRIWSFAVAGMAYPWVMGLNIAFILLWLLFRSRYLFISLLLVLAGLNVIGRFIRLNDKTTDDHGIKVVSYNVRHFTGTGTNPSRDLAELIKGFLKEKEPDIICLQEVKLRSNHIFNLQGTRNELPSIRHYQYARSGTTGGSVTMTRFPIVKMEEIRFEQSGNIAICTDVVTGNDTIRIFNIHLQSYRINPLKYRVLENQMIRDEEDLREVKELGLKYRKAVRMRAKQARLVRQKIDESPYPVIVCGDFNDTPSSYAYQKVRGNLYDSFIQSGKGIGITYVGKMPSFRIDYILHSNTFRSYNFKVYDVPYSDHLPIACDILKN